MADKKKVIVRVKRQAGPQERPRWEEFELVWRPYMNVIICLRDIAERPVTRAGEPTTPVAYESNCLEEVCGSCVMLINGKAVKAWVHIDGTYNLGEGPRMSPELQAKGYPLSRCISCGACLEVCPQVNEKNNFIGAAIISQVRLFNLHPTGAMHARERLEAVMGPGGVADCANAQNCVKICPKDIPLTESIAEVNRQAIKQALLGWLFG